MNKFKIFTVLLVGAIGCSGGDPRDRIDFSNVVDFAARDLGSSDQNAADMNQDLTKPPDFTPTIDAMLIREGKTGQACVEDDDCQNGSGTLSTKRCLKQNPWTNGYCNSSGCLTDNNDTNGFNPECPGAPSICLNLVPPMGSCFARCNSSKDCINLRGDIDYRCYSLNGNYSGGICQSKAVSQCYTRVGGDCGAGQTCVDNTVDPPAESTAGFCYPACSLFAANTCENGRGCYAQPVTGEGYCNVTPGGTVAGSACTKDVQCPSGYGCLNQKCWKYCNTANAATQCAVNGSNPGTCMQIGNGAVVQPSVVGICSVSN